MEAAAAGEGLYLRREVEDVYLQWEAEVEVEE